ANGLPVTGGSNYHPGIRYTGVANALTAGNINFTYKPSSAAVVSARLQVIVTGNSGIHAYYDNAQWFPVSALTAPVTPPAGIPGDLNKDGKVNLNDLSILSSNWNSTTATAAQGDLNGDSKVNLNDLS